MNWFSPLPPARSGIAQYAAQILPVLASQHEVRLWTDQEIVAPEMAGIGPLTKYDPNWPPWRTINEADLAVYHIGNHANFHGGIWEISRQHAGLVVLHDVYLHDFFAGLFLHFRNLPDHYTRVLARWYGRDGVTAGEGFRSGAITGEQMSALFPLTREAIWGALGVVTHSSWNGTETHEKPACPVRALSFPYAVTAAPRGPRAAANGTEARHRLIMFGHLGSNRRLESVLQALAGLPERAEFVLDICGEVWDRSYVEAQIQRLGLKESVRLHGHVTEAEMQSHFSNGDLAINLRYPSMGEASLTQMQFWDYGLPTLVTQTGWYASLSPEATAFVRPETEIADIRGHLQAFRSNPERFRAMGEKGRSLLLANHSPENYVKDLTAFAMEVQKKNRVSEFTLARRLGEEFAGWLHPDSVEAAIERVSRKILEFGPPKE